MVMQVFKSNAAAFPRLVYVAKAFEENLYFPKIRNLNRLESAHRGLSFARTEKFDGQNIVAQRRDNCLVFYSRHGLLDLPSLGKQIGAAWERTDFDTLAGQMNEDDAVYFEAVGNHRDFSYSDILTGGAGLIAFAYRTAAGALLDPTKMPRLTIPAVPVLDIRPIPDVTAIRQMLAEGREGFVFTASDATGQYVAYKAKRRELLEEATDEERAELLASNLPPAEKIARIVCTIAKVKHILQKLRDGGLPIEGDGIDDQGRWDGSNAVIPTLISAVKADCRQDSGETIDSLCRDLNVRLRDVNVALDNRVRIAFFDATLQEALAH